MKKEKPSKGNINPYIKEQAKHLKRIRQFIKNAELRGYKFYDIKVPESLNMPAGFSTLKIPESLKNPSKTTINKLKKITKEYLYDRAIYVDPETGEIHSAKQGRTIERSRASVKGAKTRALNRIPKPDVNLNLAILDTIRDYLSELETASIGAPSIADYKQTSGRYLVSFFDEMVEYHELNEDVYEYASYLESRAQEINNLIDEATKGSDRETIDMNVTALMAILNRGPLDRVQVDSFTKYTEAFGYGEG